MRGAKGKARLSVYPLSLQKQITIGKLICYYFYSRARIDYVITMYFPFFLIFFFPLIYDKIEVTPAVTNNARD